MYGKLIYEPCKLTHPGIRVVEYDESGATIIWNDGTKTRTNPYNKYGEQYKKGKTINIKKVIFSNPATIVIWEDNTKTVVKAQDGELFDPEKGLAMAIVKHLYGDTGKYYDIFKKWVPKEDHA